MVAGSQHGILPDVQSAWIIEHYSVVKATLAEWVELGGTRAGVMGSGEAGFGVPLTVNVTGECMGNGSLSDHGVIQ